MSSFSFADLPLSLQPGERRTVPVFATFVRILKASAPFTVRLNDSAEMTAGLGYSWRVDHDDRAIESVTIENRSSQEALTVLLGYGTGEMRNDAIDLTGGVDTRPALPDAVAHGVKTITAGNFGKIVDSNPSRRNLFLRNASADVLRIQINTGGGSSGLYFGPGERVSLEIATAVWISAPDSATDVDVEWWEESYA
jgi:hypothetical protein